MRRVRVAVAAGERPVGVVAVAEGDVGSREASEEKNER
jgi:hypothetical protein